MLENIRQRLDDIEAGAHSQPGTIHTRKEEKHVPNRNDHELYADQSDEEAN